MRQFITLLLSIFFIIGTRLAAEVVPVWSTGVALPGEQVVLYLVDAQSGDNIFQVKKQPKVKGATVRMLRLATGANPLDPNRATVAIQPFAVKADGPGMLEIGEIELEYKDGRTETVKVPPLSVRSTSDIIWYDSPVPYGVLWETAPKDGYVHQPVKVAAKLLYPGDCLVNYPPTLNAVGVKVGTLTPAVEGVVALVQSQFMEATTAYAKGQNWRTSNFIGTLTPYREGKSDVAGKVAMARVHGLFTVAQEEIPLPTLTVSALPLPPGAPANFANTVGRYSIAAKSDAAALAMNEAVEVEITVRGTGNLEQLACPKPEGEENWKLVPATRKPMTGVNNETVGMVFTQLMRPTTEVGGIPSFSFSYFDPEAEEYRNASTRPIPMPWQETDAVGSGLQTTAAEPPPAGHVPVEEMTDIYGEFQGAGANPQFTLPRRLMYLLYLPAIGILLTLFGKWIHRRVAAGAEGRALERELAAIGRTADGLAFLKAIGAFIESRLPNAARNPELQDILNKRDDVAFRPDAKAELGETERQNMLKRVRKALGAAGTTALLLIACLMPTVQAADDSAEQAYTARQYSKCIQILDEELATAPTAAAYFNKANCLYRLNQPGKAALNYARALQEAPYLKEARANLAFIQRKEGAILPLRSTTDEAFTLLTPNELWFASILITATLTLCIALLVARRGQRKPWLQACTAATALLSLLCGLDWVYYATRETPDLSSLPPTDIAYVLEATDARSAAAEDAASVIPLTPSTPLHLLAQRGSWSYVETFTGTRGWVPSSSIEALIPGAPTPIPLYIRLK